MTKDPKLARLASREPAQHCVGPEGRLDTDEAVANDVEHENDDKDEDLRQTATDPGLSPYTPQRQHTSCQGLAKSTDQTSGRSCASCPSVGLVVVLARSLELW